MTKEEAKIIIFNQWQSFLENTIDYGGVSEAYKIAIKELEREPKILNALDFAIDASNGDTDYFVGFRNGLRYVKSLIDGKEPQYENCSDQEPCEDAISRQAVLEPYKPLYDTDTICIWVLRKNIEQIPPVTPKQKMGHWIGHREHCEELGVMPSGLGAYEWCSNCDCGIDVKEWHRNNYNYCPNCGAKMAESED